MTIQQNLIYIKDGNCPWCQKHFVWGESTLKVGAKTQAHCSNSLYVTRRFQLNNKYCNFNCIGERGPSLEMIFYCDKEYYYSGFTTYVENFGFYLYKTKKKEIK